MTRSSAAATTVLVAVVAALGGGAVLAPAADTTAPKPFRLVLERGHVGRFVASGVFCSTGRVSAPTGDRRLLLTCEDGSGSATALVDPTDGEDGGVGGWRIVAGTGAHARLRGRGTFRNLRAGSTWIGVADRDDRPPTVAFTRTSVTPLPGPRHGYVLRLACALRDAPGTDVRYRVAITADGAFLASRVGETNAGTVTAVLRLQPARAARALRVAIRALDPLGNERTVSRLVRLPS